MESPYSGMMHQASAKDHGNTNKDPVAAVTSQQGQHHQLRQFIPSTAPRRAMVSGGPQSSSDDRAAREGMKGQGQQQPSSLQQGRGGPQRGMVHGRGGGGDSGHT